MGTLQIFDRDINGQSYSVWVTDGIVQFAIGGEIRTNITSVSDFLATAARAINKPNVQDSTVVESFGSISDDALENYQNGSVGFDSGGTNPSISLQDGDTEVKIGGGGVGGSFRVDFGSGTSAQTEAATFLAFAQDLLGKATATELEQMSGVQIGDFSRTVTISSRDDDIREIKFSQTGERNAIEWADRLVEQIAADFDGTKERDGLVSETTSLNPAQVKIVDGGFSVDLGSQGVGGKEVWSFETQEDADGFRSAVLDKLGNGADRSGLLDDVIERLAADLGGDQIRDGRVSDRYEARQIKLMENDDGVFVDLGSHRVGGKERYDFGEDLDGALAFISGVRDLVGVGAREGKLVDDFIYNVSGGAGISGSPTFVGKDDFIEFIGAEFGGDRLRDGSVSESFGGGGRITEVSEDEFLVQLGPRGVGGKEVWEFDNAADANGFIATLDDLFG